MPRRLRHTGPQTVTTRKIPERGPPSRRRHGAAGRAVVGIQLFTVGRQTVHRGRVAYSPNSLGGGCPFQAMIADAGFANARTEPMLGGLVCIWSGWKI